MWLSFHNWFCLGFQVNRLEEEFDEKPMLNLSAEDLAKVPDYGMNIPV